MKRNIPLFCILRASLQRKLQEMSKIQLKGMGPRATNAMASTEYTGAETTDYKLAVVPVKVNKGSCVVETCVSWPRKHCNILQGEINSCLSEGKEQKLWQWVTKSLWKPIVWTDWKHVASKVTTLLNSQRSSHRAIFLSAKRTHLHRRT